MKHVEIEFKEFLTEGVIIVDNEDLESWSEFSNSILSSLKAKDLSRVHEHTDISNINEARILVKAKYH